MNDTEYHAHPAMGSTTLKTARTKTGRGFWAKCVDPNRKPFLPTDPMRQGSLVDCLETCPDKFDDKYIILPSNAPTKPTKAQLKAEKKSPAAEKSIKFWEEFEEEAGDRDIITKDWKDTALVIIDVLHADRDVGPILKMPRQSQVPFFWFDQELFGECKYKPDLEPDDLSLWDLKKGASANPRDFERQSYSLGYDIQLDHYGIGFAKQHGIEPTRRGFIVYEWAWPHDCALIVADEDFIAMGAKRRAEAIALILQYRADGYYPSYGSAIISPPKYAGIISPGNDSDVSDLELEGLE